MLIVLAGRTASGKSTVGKLLAERLAGTFASFGSYVRALAESLGLDANDRLTLQNLGQSRVDQDAQGFADGFLEQAAWAAGKILVVEGLRHQSVLTALQRASMGDRVILIYLDIPDDVRRQRLMARNLSGSEIAAIEQHPSEADVLSNLASRADFTVRGDLPLEDVVGTVMEIVAP